MYRIIMDCDPGHDDVIALMAMLAHPETFELLGITTVAGNQTIEKVTDNALKVLDYLGFSRIPVSQGAAKPLCREPGEPACVKNCPNRALVYVEVGGDTE